MKKSASLITVFLAVFIDLIGFGIVLPLLPFYASTFQATPVQIGLLYSIYSFSQLIFSPIWGSLSDRVGRRPIMLISTFGAFFAYLLFGFSHSFALLFLSRLIAGVMGGNISTAQAYVADVTTHEDRAKGMGLIGAAFGVGFVMGPAISSLLIHPIFLNFFNIPEEHRYAIPGFFAALLSFVSFLLIFFKLPETVTRPSHEDYKTTKSVLIFSKAFWQSIPSPILLGTMFLLCFSQASMFSSFPLFGNHQLHLSAAEVGPIYVCMGLISVIVQGGLIRLLTKKFKEEILFITGCILMVFGMMLIPFAFSQTSLILFLCLMSTGGSLNFPTLNSLISKKANPSEVGSMMGASQGMASLGRTVGPTWGGFLYGMSYRLPFIVTASLLSLTVIVGLKFVNSKTKENIK